MQITDIINIENKIRDISISKSLKNDESVESFQRILKKTIVQNNVESKKFNREKDKKLMDVCIQMENEIACSASKTKTFQ